MSDKGAFRIILTISVLVCLAVVVLNRRLLPAPEAAPSFAYILPAINAVINGICTVLLLLSFRAIKQKKVSLHKMLNLTTFALSSLFLISYVAFHYFVKETTYGGTGLFKGVYYFILITHIVLAALVLPLVLLSFYHALKGNTERHRKIAKVTWPIWIYVTFTGVWVYLMISPYYTF